MAPSARTTRVGRTEACRGLAIVKSAPFSFVVAEEPVRTDEQDQEDEKENRRLRIKARAVSGHERFHEPDGEAAGGRGEGTAEPAENGGHEAFHGEQKPHA